MSDTVWIVYFDTQQHLGGVEVFGVFTSEEKAKEAVDELDSKVKLYWYGYMPVYLDKIVEKGVNFE